jgi:membrane protease YdiL (CAAX protease family)
MLTGSTLIASVISLSAFGLAHVPLWGLAPALTTLVSGGIMTLMYVWRRDVVALMIAHVIADLFGIL